MIVKVHPKYFTNTEKISRENIQITSVIYPVVDTTLHLSEMSFFFFFFNYNSHKNKSLSGFMAAKSVTL